MGRCIRVYGIVFLYPPRTAAPVRGAQRGLAWSLLSLFLFFSLPPFTFFRDLSLFPLQSPWEQRWLFQEMLLLLRAPRIDFRYLPLCTLSLSPPIRPSVRLRTHIHGCPYGFFFFFLFFLLQKMTYAHAVFFSIAFRTSARSLTLSFSVAGFPFSFSGESESLQRYLHDPGY